VHTEDDHTATPAGGDGAPTPLAGLTVLQVGHFDPEYARNRIMAKALRRAGATVIQSSDERTFARRTPSLMARTMPHRPDLVLVGFPGHLDVPAAKVIGSVNRAPVIFDALTSLYEMSVEDRRSVPARSAQALRLLAEDRLACQLSDLVVLDTDSHISYFASRFRVPREKFRRVWVGSDDEIMYPRPAPPRGGFRVLFYGTFIPLHGLDHIVTAAHLLERSGESVEVVVVGTGQTHDEVRALADRLGVSSVRFEGRRPYEMLPALIAESDLCLGIFGTSDKAQRVIPNKVFDALAMARPVITADSPAAREALVHGEHAWLCPPGDAEALAGAIVRLKGDPEAREHLGREGYRLFTEQFSLDAQSRRLAAVVGDVLASTGRA
jgi:glycosyltransferase involved in cell wall biosynthesis